MRNRFFPDRCSRCVMSTDPIPGDGPKPAQLFFIGDKPGPQENRRRRVWIGDAGKEFDRLYLPLSGFDRSDIYITNCLRCFRTADSTDEQVTDCAETFLPAELASVQPAIIIPMGAQAISLFPGLELDTHHGIPFYRELYGQEYIVMPTYNPAAGMHQDRYMIPIKSDFRELYAIARGVFHMPEDEYPNPDYQLIEHPRPMELILRDAKFRHETFLTVAMDTEFWRETAYSERIYSLSLSTAPGNGYVVMADNLPVLGEIRQWIEQVNPMVAFHHELADLPKLAQVRITPVKRVDTMRMSYHLQDLPQGLKVLAYRLAGMVMEDYDDLVRPYYHQAVFNYLISIANTDYSKYRAFRKSALNKRAEKIVRETLEGKHKDPGELWTNISPVERRPAEDVWGYCPVPSIRLVPIPKLVFYGSRDSDATLRVLPILRRRLIERRRQVNV